MSPSLKPATQEKLRRFSQLFPEFYEQFVSSDTQYDNLKLAYQLYKQKQANLRLSYWVSLETNCS